MKKEKLFNEFTNLYSFENLNFGVKRLRLEEEMFMFLNLLSFRSK